MQVYDYDATSRNDLIGFAEVPLRGVLLSGRISTGLRRLMNRPYALELKHSHHLNAANRSRP